MFKDVATTLRPGDITQNGTSTMQKIETEHVRALYLEIGERMRASRPETELPAGLEAQMDQLSKLDEEPFNRPKGQRRE